MQELLDIQTAVKLIRREREKFPNELLEVLIREYNNDWFDGVLVAEDLRRIESAYLKAFPEWWEALFFVACATRVGIVRNLLVEPKREQTTLHSSMVTYANLRSNSSVIAVVLLKNAQIRPFDNEKWLRWQLRKPARL